MREGILALLAHLGGRTGIATAEVWRQLRAAIVARERALNPSPEDR